MSDSERPDDLDGEAPKSRRVVDKNKAGRQQMFFSSESSPKDIAKALLTRAKELGYWGFPEVPQMKTSETHPLQIQTVTHPGKNATIGMTLCPGRKGPSLAGGAWDRDLEADLIAVRAWKPDAVISLLEDHEFAELAIPHFREAVERDGLPWMFAPIPDGGIPRRAFDLAWAEIAPRVRDILGRDGRILIHCRAGLGRTGLIAACLLVDLGSSPQEAIDAVRAARPGTIETREQEDYVRRHRRPFT